MLSRDEETDLAGLRWNWENAYTFAVIDGIWTAKPADHLAVVLTADSADELRLLVRADYFARDPAAAARVPVTDHLSERMST